MQFLSLSQRRKGFAESDYASLAEQEMERARKLYAEGFIRQIWHRVDMPGACLLWEAGGEAQVREMWATFPFEPYGGFRPTKSPKIRS